MLIANCNSAAPRKGFVLLAVLVVVVLLTLSAYQFSELMSAEYQAADSYRRSAQAHALAESGIHFAAAALSNADNIANVLGNNPYDNAGAFQGVLVRQSDVPRFQGRFSILAPIDPDEQAGGGYRFGVRDEAGKINLNALLKLDSSGQIAHDILIKLPNMTEEIVNAILDWIDADDNARSGGAESDVYLSQNPPYRCKNGPLDTLDELLWVRGVTPQLLFGNDKNRNGVLDPDEDDGNGFDPGWSAYLTVYSRERNVANDDTARININDADLNNLSSQLNTALGPDLANFILAYRLYGASQQGQGGSGGTTGGSAAAAPTPRTTASPAALQAASSRILADLSTSSQQRPRSIASLYDLINATVDVPSGNTATSSQVTVLVAPGGNTMAFQQTTTASQNSTTPLPSPLNDPSQLRQLLPVMLDKLTTVRDTELPARINVNTASRAVLLTLPGLTETDVAAILEARASLTGTDETDPVYQTPAWLMTEAKLPAATLKTLERYITARTQVYRVQALGHFDSGGPTARVEAVIDTNGGRPRILYWRDLTELGKGFNLTNQQ